MIEPLMKDREVSQQLGVATQTLAKWPCTGAVKLPWCKVGDRVRYRQSDVQKFIESRMRGESSDDGGRAGGARRLRESR